MERKNVENLLDRKRLENGIEGMRECV